jgi:glycerate-2-kinase
MTAGLRRIVEQIFLEALQRVHAGAAVTTVLRGSSSDRLMVSGDPLPVPDAGIYAIAIGKAAAEMMAAVQATIGERFAHGIVITKIPPSVRISRVRVVLGSHPVPDRRSLDAGDELLTFARAIPSGALVLCLISGGGSALAEVLRDGVTLDQLRVVTQRLLRAGASIRELNAVRSRMSQIKAGGLLDVLAHTQVVNLIVSDVLGDDLHAIASGPTVPPYPGADADEILRRHRIDLRLPPAVRDDNVPASPVTRVVASLSLAIDAAAESARARGFAPVVLTRSIDGEAREVGRLTGAILTDIRRGGSTLHPPVCLLGGGEMVVTVRGQGVGGRNTEAALSAAARLAGVEEVALGFLATDGDDGSTGATGAIVDGWTVPRGDIPAAIDALDRNDSYTYLERRGAIQPGSATGTNVNDLVVGLVQ